MIRTEILKVTDYPVDKGLYLARTTHLFKEDNIFNDSGNGQLIAHDLFEHINLEEIGTIQSEIKAYGAMHYVRGEEISQRQYTSGKQIFINDLSALYDNYIRTPYNNIPPIKKQRCDYSEYFSEIVQDVILTIKDLNLEDYSKETKKEYVQYLLDYLCLGYNTAKRIYRGKYMTDTFWNLADKVSKMHLEIDSYSNTFELKFDYSGYCKWRKIET